jgi:hypothetical protein
MSGVIYIKDAGVWTSVNFPNDGTDSMWVKDAGVWEELPNDITAKKVHVKDGGVWYQVFPSTSSSATSAVLGSSVVQGSYVPIDFRAAHPYTKAITSAEVGWEADSQTGDGRTFTVSDFVWTPTTDSGFEYGAITSIEMTCSVIRYTVGGSDLDYKFKIDGGSTRSLSVTSGLWTAKSISGSPSSWGLTDQQAGDLHLAGAGLTVWPDVQLSLPSFLFGIKNVQLTLTYAHN